MPGIERGRTGSSAWVTAAAAVAGGTSGWMLATRRQRRVASRLHRVLVELLLKTLTAGDPETARHSRRVAALVDVIADNLRLGRQERATLRIAALLHDVGKVDDELFRLVHLPEPLTEDERARIRRHPHTSADILEPLEPFHPGILATVRGHHECWNGDGYPDGIAGEEIPVAARIISIADVFDALTQPRSYRDPVEPDAAIERIAEAGGVRFDPRLVELLRDPRVRREWETIARRWRMEEEAAASAA
jgi:putative nucleotidyltransferase with HDIG domain